MKTNEQLIRWVAALKSRYVEAVLRTWMDSRQLLVEDWFAALDFFLGHVYFQGRTDTLSDRYHKASIRALKTCLGPDLGQGLGRAWSEHWFPRDPQWNGFDENRSPLMLCLQQEKAGKRRDMQMVLDALRYIYALPGWNVVCHSRNEISSGRMAEHAKSLDGIWQVGAKTSAFYLRDLCWVYDLPVGECDNQWVQPVDTWVQQIAVKLGIVNNNDSLGAVVTKIVAACDIAGVSPADFNVGAWYLGTNSLDIAIEVACRQLEGLGG